MPLLDRFRELRSDFARRPGEPSTLAEVVRSGAFSRRCENPRCNGRRPFAVRSKAPPGPRFEGRSICSRSCLQALVVIALQRELLNTQAAVEPYRHRLPLGLLMLSRRSITREQLVAAVASQKIAGHGKLGEWLIRTQGVDEEVIASGLAAQWGLPLLSAGPDLRSARLLPRLLPRLLIDVFGVVPVHLAARKILYLAVDEQVDRCLYAAIEAMTGYRVEFGVMKPSAYQALRRAVLAEPPGPDRLFKTGSIAELQEGIAGLLAESGDALSRIRRIGDYLWLRIEKVRLANMEAVTPELQDILFTLPHRD